MLIFTGLVSNASIGNSIQGMKDNWGEHRCNPAIMPFAALFGYDTKSNFDSCMKTVFETHSQPFMEANQSSFSGFTGVLGTMFGSINSLRNSLATMRGGINVIISEFTERISMFFFRLQVSAITIKALIGRMYAIMFSVMYMGLSGISGMTSFTNTFLFSFLDTFCFPGDTEIVAERGLVNIKDIRIGDIIKGSRVESVFRFNAKGQPMVRLGKTIVSTNHYVMYNGKPVKAISHPDAIKITDTFDELYCLNTHNNRIPINDYIFLDYDETTIADKDAMNYIEGRINGTTINKEYNFTEYRPAIDENISIKTIHGNKLAKDIVLGDKLVTGSEVVGLIRTIVHETCMIHDVTVTPSTLYWTGDKWIRAGDTVKKEIRAGDTVNKEIREMISFIVTPHSQIELENGVRIRDYMELCSPDSEIHYTKSFN
jgi:hypothetical protein